MALESLTSDDCCRCEAVARKILKGFYLQLLGYKRDGLYCAGLWKRHASYGSGTPTFYKYVEVVICRLVR